jgi:inorganic phosphate transporter, PiT family
MLTKLKAQSAEITMTKTEYKKMRQLYRVELVKRTIVYKIIGAWVITLPASALMASLIYLAMSRMLS